MIPKPGAITQPSVQWGEGGQLLATFRSDTVGGLHGKAPALLLWGSVNSKRLPPHPISHLFHGEALSRGQEGREGKGNANQPTKAPPSGLFQARELNLSISDPPPGARDGQAGSAFGNDSGFPVWFLSRGLWDILTCIIVYICILHSSLSLLIF